MWVQAGLVAGIGNHGKGTTQEGCLLKMKEQPTLQLNREISPTALRKRRWGASPHLEPLGKQVPRDQTLGSSLGATSLLILGDVGPTAEATWGHHSMNSEKDMWKQTDAQKAKRRAPGNPLAKGRIGSGTRRTTLITTTSS